jgi:hypothetical protein
VHGVGEVEPMCRKMSIRTRVHLRVHQAETLELAGVAFVCSTNPQKLLQK